MKFCPASVYYQVRSSYNASHIKWTFSSSHILLYRNTSQLHTSIATVSAALGNIPVSLKSQEQPSNL